MGRTDLSPGVIQLCGLRFSVDEPLVAFLERGEAFKTHRVADVSVGCRGQWRAHAGRVEAGESSPESCAPEAAKIVRSELKTADGEPAVTIFVGDDETIFRLCWQSCELRMKVHPGSREVTVDLQTGFEPDEVLAAFERVVVAGCAAAEGALVLHAAVVSKDQGPAILLAGEPGSGKSTAARLLLEEGWSVLSDDLAVLWDDGDGRFRVASTRADFRVGAAFGDEGERYGRRGRAVFRGREKWRWHPGVRPDHGVEAPVGAFAVYERHSSVTDAAWHDWNGQNALYTLLHYRYSPGLNVAERSRRDFEHCASLANEIMVGQLHLPLQVDGSTLSTTLSDIITRAPRHFAPADSGGDRQ